MMEEKRRSPRVDVICKISAVFGERLLVFNVHTENIGEGGARFILGEKLHISTVVEIELFFPHQKTPLKCRGAVIWANEVEPVGVKPQLFDTGIKFIEVEDKNKEPMRKAIEFLLSRQMGKK